MHARIVFATESAHCRRVVGDAGAEVGSATRRRDRAGSDEQCQESAGRENQSELRVMDNLDVLVGVFARSTVAPKPETQLSGG